MTEDVQEYEGRGWELSQACYMLKIHVRERDMVVGEADEKSRVLCEYMRRLVCEREGTVLTSDQVDGAPPPPLHIPQHGATAAGAAAIGIPVATASPVEGGQAALPDEEVLLAQALSMSLSLDGGDAGATRAPRGTPPTRPDAFFCRLAVASTDGTVAHFHLGTRGSISGSISGARDREKKDDVDVVARRDGDASLAGAGADGDGRPASFAWTPGFL